MIPRASPINPHEAPKMDTYPPTCESLKAYLQHHQLTYKEVARRLHIDPSTPYKWTRGKPEIPFTAWYTLRCLVEKRLPY